VRVVFDHQIFSCQRYGGISRSHCVQAAYLDTVPGVTCRVVAPRHANHHLRQLPACLVRGEYVPDAPPAGALLAANRAASMPLLAELAPDVVHETYCTGQDPLRGGWQVAVTVHDMTHERYPDLCHPADHTAEHKREAVARADCVICPSESTRADLVAILGVDPDTIFVVPNAGTPLAPVSDDRHGGAGAPFFLYVGNRGGFKNFTMLLEAFAGSARLRRELRLVCAGGGDFTAGEGDTVARLGLERSVECRPQCSDAGLANLYATARGLVFPSLCEGFGMPVVEAMQAGCPVACARATALPEVAGDAALYFDPASSEDMAGALERLAFDDDLCAGLRRRGLDRGNRFLPENCLPALVAAYNGLK